MTSSKPFVILFAILIVCVAMVLFFSYEKKEPINNFKVTTNLPLEENGGVPVNIQDQATRPFDITVNQIINDSYALTTTPIVNSYNFTLNTITGLAVGDKIAFLEQNGMPQLHFGEILDIVGNVVVLDTPMPFNFTASETVVFEYTDELSIDGSVNAQEFRITNFFDEAVDITRFLFVCVDDLDMDDSKFCSIGDGLTRGLVLRKQKIDGHYINYWNVKTNGEWAELAYDAAYAAKAKQGEFGFRSRLTYGGQEKHGVVIRLQPNESIEVLVQDDLTELSTASLMVQGHFIQN